MTLAYCADALIYDVDRDAYALRPDYDPGLHRVDIIFGQALGWPTEEDAGWNDPKDPAIAQVRDMSGTPVHAGHAYVADRFILTGPGGTKFRVDLLEIDHDSIGFVVGAPLAPGVTYPLAESTQPYRVKEDIPAATGFGPGTMIATRQGDLPVEWLAKGDEVLTVNGTLQPLRWVGYARLSARHLARHPMLRPVCLNANALGLGEPVQDLKVAPDTQLLLSGPRISLNFGLDRALANAGDLIEPGTGPAIMQGLTYFMLLFDQHQVVHANGHWCASLFADARTKNRLAPQFSTLPPHIRHDHFALPCLKDWEVELIRDQNIRVKPQLFVAA